jgi:hypothetical protein
VIETPTVEKMVPNANELNPKLLEQLTQRF